MKAAVQKLVCTEEQKICLLFIDKLIMFVWKILSASLTHSSHQLITVLITCTVWQPWGATCNVLRNTHFLLDNKSEKMKKKQNKKKISLKTQQEPKRNSEDTTTKQKAQPFRKHNNKNVSENTKKKTDRPQRCFGVVHLMCCLTPHRSAPGKKNMLAVILKLLLTAGDANNKEGISANQTGKSTANTLCMWEHILIDVNGI